MFLPSTYADSATLCYETRYKLLALIFIVEDVWNTLKGNY